MLFRSRLTLGSIRGGKASRLEIDRELCNNQGSRCEILRYNGAHLGAPVVVASAVGCLHTVSPGYGPSKPRLRTRWGTNHDLRPKGKLGSRPLRGLVEGSRGAKKESKTTNKRHDLDASIIGSPSKRDHDLSLDGQLLLVARVVGGEVTAFRPSPAETSCNLQLSPHGSASPVRPHVASVTSL